MYALHIALYAVLGTSAAFALVELGVCAYVASLYGGTVEEAYYNVYYGWEEKAVKFTTPPILDFLLFSAVWTLLISAGALILPWFYSRRATGAKLNQLFAGLLISVYFITWVFWLASFADLASYLGGGVSYNNYFNAILAFAILLWLLFVALFVLNIIAICGVLASDWPGYIAIRGGQREVGPNPLGIRLGQSTTEMDDATLNRLVDDLMRNVPGVSGAFHSNPNHAEIENDIHRQYLMASLRHGYFGTEPVPVDATGRLDVDYGNRGPEIGMVQQMTSTGVLAAVNSEEYKQKRYRSLSLFPRETFGDGPMMEEMNALEADDDVHSVSVISGLHDEDPARYKHCSVDCWLKTLQHADYSAAPALSTSHERHPEESLNDDQTPPYEKIENNQKRLISLLPGHYGDPIICKVIVLTVSSPQFGNGPSSDTQLEYEALSYTWGDPIPIHPIEFDGKMLLIPGSAFTALQHLRHETDTRTLWIDAICINQKDKTERSEQVVHMNQIYKSASRVIVWLGEGFEDSHLAMTSMRYLDQKAQREEITLRTHDEICYEQLKRIYKAQCRIFESPWFRRSWIRQEVMVAKDITIVCGRDTIPWYCMKRSAARVRRLYHKMMKENVADLTEFHNDQSEAIACLTRDWIYGQPVAKFIGCIRSIWYYHAGGLLDLLMTGREYGASDERDKVYSVLGLARVPMTAGPTIPAPDTRTPAFPVDYHKSVSEVYQDVVKFFINRDRNLDILSILLTHRNSASDRDLPSWVLDWRVPISEIPLMAHWDFIDMKVAAGGFRVETLPQSFDEKGILRVQGYVFDAIQQLDDRSANVHNVLCTLAEFDDDEDGPVNQARQRGEVAMFSVPFDPQKHRARCCRTVKGDVCLASVNARPRDYIAVFLGAKHLFVIRPIEPKTLGSEASNTSIRATVVGPCIVPHAMFGRLVKVAREKNIALTEFTLL